jgi:hypothetical protein
VLHLITLDRNMTTMPLTIVSEDDIQSFFTYLITEEGLNFHPDTPFSDYISLTNGAPY